MLWWSGQNLVDLSPYIADAYYRGLPLVGGGGEDSHDWGNLLTMTGLLDSHMTLARTAFFCGSVTMLAVSLKRFGIEAVENESHKSSHAF